MLKSQFLLLHSISFDLWQENFVPAGEAQELLKDFQESDPYEFGIYQNLRELFQHNGFPAQMTVRDGAWAAAHCGDPENQFWLWAYMSETRQIELVHMFNTCLPLPAGMDLTHFMWQMGELTNRMNAHLQMGHIKTHIGFDPSKGKDDEGANSFEEILFFYFIVPLAYPKHGSIGINLLQSSLDFLIEVDQRIELPLQKLAHSLASHHPASEEANGGSGMNLLPYTTTIEEIIAEEINAPLYPLEADNLFRHLRDQLQYADFQAIVVSGERCFILEGVHRLTEFLVEWRIEITAQLQVCIDCILQERIPIDRVCEVIRYLNHAWLNLDWEIGNFFVHSEESQVHLRSGFAAHGSAKDITIGMISNTVKRMSECSDLIFIGVLDLIRGQVQDHYAAYERISEALGGGEDVNIAVRKLTTGVMPYSPLTKILFGESALQYSTADVQDQQSAVESDSESAVAKGIPASEFFGGRAKAGSSEAITTLAFSEPLNNLPETDQRLRRVLHQIVQANVQRKQAEAEQKQSLSQKRQQVERRAEETIKKARAIQESVIGLSRQAEQRMQEQKSIRPLDQLPVVMDERQGIPQEQLKQVENLSKQAFDAIEEALDRLEAYQETLRNQLLLRLVLTAVGLLVILGGVVGIGAALYAIIDGLRERLVPSLSTDFSLGITVVIMLIGLGGMAAVGLFYARWKSYLPAQKQYSGKYSQAQSSSPGPSTFCGFCGKTTPGSAMFCPHCGKQRTW